MLLKQHASVMAGAVYKGVHGNYGINLVKGSGSISLYFGKGYTFIHIQMGTS